MLCFHIDVSQTYLVEQITVEHCPVPRPHYYTRPMRFGSRGPTVEPRYNDPRYNDIPGIPIDMLCPGKSYSKMYGTEPRYNDLRYNDEFLAHRA